MPDDALQQDARDLDQGRRADRGEVKFFAYSDFKDYTEDRVLFDLRDDVTLVELYKNGAIESRTWKSWKEFAAWLDGLDENGVQISLKLPSLVLLRRARQGALDAELHRRGDQVGAEEGR